MGYAVLHIDKARGNDSAMSAHIERTFVPNNVDASRTHLNRDLVQFPANVTNRTEAIAHRIATAGIYRKVADNQVKALRFILSGSHEDMLQLESDGRLEEWCNSTMQWLIPPLARQTWWQPHFMPMKRPRTYMRQLSRLSREKGEKPNRKLRMASESTRQRQIR